MNLNDALGALADQLGLDANSLIADAQLDTVGGYDTNAAQAKWEVGSIWGVEGQVLYALTRALQPERIAECGVNQGCSSTHFLTALRANGSGELHSIDPWEGAGVTIPQELRSRWDVHYALGTEWLTEQPDASFDILFEDMVHGDEATRDWWIVAQQKIRPGGVILSHDATHPTVGADVQRGIAESGVEATMYSIEPGDCGLAIWKAPGNYVSQRERQNAKYNAELEAQATPAHTDETNVPVEPQPKAPPAAKRATTARKPAAKRATAKK